MMKATTRLLAEVLVILSFFLSSCKENGNEKDTFFCKPTNNKVDISINNLSFEELDVNPDNTSYVGFSGIYGNKLFFADRLFSTLYQFDATGKCEGAKILHGNGPSEIPARFEDYTISDDGHHFFIGSSTDIYEFDGSFNKVNNYMFLNKKISEGDVYEKTDFYMTFYSNVNMTVNDGILYMNVTGGNDDLDMTSKDYYGVSRIIEKRQAATGDIIGYYGRMSPSVGYMTAFQKDFFRINDAGDIFVAYEADDLIYVYDKDFKIKYSFGQSGKSMNRDYLELKVDGFASMLQSEQDTKGRYTSLRVSNGLVFRTYWTGLPNNKTRLQIYDGTTLIGDVDAPDNFKVLGYIAPYYYSEFICDEEAETMKLYRFKLDR